MPFKILLISLLLFSCQQKKAETIKESSSENVTSIKKELSNIHEPEYPKQAIDTLKIKTLIKCFKEKNIEKIANRIFFPLEQGYPISPIQNKKEFKERFNEVFDENLISIIAKSKIDQWNTVGWRGTMLNNGLVWLGDYENISAINYETEIQNDIRKVLISKDKKKLHTSINNYLNPICKFQTKNYLIRVDEISECNFRYSSWKKGKNPSSKPDLVISNGDVEFLGTGGNHVYIFKNQNYVYKVYGNIIGKIEDLDFTLEVEKDGYVILNQNGNFLWD